MDYNSNLGIGLIYFTMVFLVRNANRDFFESEFRSERRIRCPIQ
jgi:low affinity Fe/Cu permease